MVTRKLVETTIKNRKLEKSTIKIQIDENKNPPQLIDNIEDSNK